MPCLCSNTEPACLIDDMPHAHLHTMLHRSCRASASAATVPIEETCCLLNYNIYINTNNEYLHVDDDTWRATKGLLAADTVAITIHHTALYYTALHYTTLHYTTLH